MQHLLFSIICYTKMACDSFVWVLSQCFALHGGGGKDPRHKKQYIWWDNFVYSPFFLKLSHIKQYQENVRCIVYNCAVDDVAECLPFMCSSAWILQKNVNLEDKNALCPYMGGIKRTPCEQNSSQRPLAEGNKEGFLFINSSFPVSPFMALVSGLACWRSSIHNCVRSGMS